MIGNIMGVMEVAGLLGIIAHHSGEPLTYWQFQLAYWFTIIPIFWVIALITLGKKKHSHITGSGK